MRTKALSILLCMTLILTAMPFFTINAWAQTGADEPILAYVPLDNRTVNVDRVVYEAESAGFQVMMPDADLYATRLDGQPLNINGTQFGDSQKLMDWITEMDKKTDYFVISLDQLLSGGLVNSRSMTNTGCRREAKLIDAVVELSKNNHVYVLDTVARLATCTVGYQGATLETYNYLRQYSINPRTVLKGSNLTIRNITMDYSFDSKGRMITVGSSHKRVVLDALHTRARKLKLIDDILTKDEEGNIKYFIGIDDSNSQNTIQTNEINYIKKKMGDRGLIYSGTDELGMMAVLSLMIDYYGYDVNAATVYFGDTESSSSGSVYDMETVKDNLEKHLRSIGVQLTEPENADLEIVVLTTPSQNILSTKYINRTIDYINGNIAKGIPTILINSAPSAYGSSLEYRMIRECEMSMLLSYSSWGTVGNSIGLALGNGISRYLYLHSRGNSSDIADIAFLKGLIFSFEKDISYIRGGGKNLFNKYLASKGWSASNFYQSDSQAAEVHTDLENILKTSDYNVTVNDIIDNLTGCRYFKGLGGECGMIGKIGLSNYSAPFFRTYEIRFDIDVKLSDVTINGFREAMSVSMPYNPQEGQLTYSVTLYYLDEEGKLHKIPCTYNKETGTIQFAAGLTGFFTDTLSMDAEKAYSLFKDVSSSDWYFDDVMYAYEKGLMKGTTSNTFAPNVLVTRAMLAQILYGMAGSPEWTSQSEPAKELQHAWYGAAMIWATENGIMPEYTYEAGKPEDYVTREQLADILWRFAKYQKLDVVSGDQPGVYSYADVFAVTAELRDGFDWVCTNGMITGKGDGTRLMPQEAATRAELAVILRRFSELNL